VHDVRGLRVGVHDDSLDKTYVRNYASNSLTGWKAGSANGTGRPSISICFSESTPTACRYVWNSCAWFTSPSLTSAAANDLELYRSLLKFKKIHTKISSKTCTVLNRHTWYLTEELISLSLFNEDIPTEARSLLAKKIHRQAASGELEIQKPTLPLITEKSKINDIVGERSRLLFDLLEIPLDFLADDEWYLLPEYTAVKNSLKNLTSINDSAVRALATRVNTHITRGEDSYQELLQVVEAHRKKYAVKTKKDLKTFC
jgi:hypothetical protein